MSVKEEFGLHLKKAAGQRNISLSDLAEKTGVHLSNLSNLASGKRPCGFAMADRLANAIDLWGPERMRFLQLASRTTVRKSTTPDQAHVAYPAAVRDLVAQVLSTERIFPDDIAAVESICDSNWPIIRLKSGSRIKLHLTLMSLSRSPTPRGST